MVFFLVINFYSWSIPHICHFFYTGRIFENQILHQKKTTKGTKNTKNVSEKVKYMHFFHSIWKNLHLTEIFYTDMSVVSVTNMRYVVMMYLLRTVMSGCWGCGG